MKVPHVMESFAVIPICAIMMITFLVNQVNEPNQHAQTLPSFIISHVGHINYTTASLYTHLNGLYESISQHHFVIVSYQLGSAGKNPKQNLLFSNVYQFFSVC